VAVTDPTDLAVDVLAAHRLTRLVTADVITEPARERLLRWAYRRHGDTGSEPATGWTDYAEVDPDAPRLARLVTCRWCAGFYVSAGVVAARRWLPGWSFLAKVLATSSAAALLAAPED
jgi:hypothetical protein